MFTKYFFHTLLYNPAYAGAGEQLQLRMVFREQWLGIPEGPQTFGAQIHTPTRNDRVGLGLQLLEDRIGNNGFTAIRFSYAYRISFGDTRLSIGLQAGLENWRTETHGLTLQSPADAAFLEAENSWWLPNFGIGTYLESERWYLGFSLPNLLEWELGAVNTDQLLYRRDRHWYATAGLVLPIDHQWILKPSVLYKSVLPGSSLGTGNQVFSGVAVPDEIEVDVAVCWKETIWWGLSLRTAVLAVLGQGSSFDSFDVWLAYQWDPGFRLGLAFDYPLTPLNNFTFGSLEAMVGYDLSLRRKRIRSPRFF